MQTFTENASPEQGPPRLGQLQNLLRVKGASAAIIPRTDIHQGEYVASCDERLAWLTGFTGSAGFCVATRDKAAIFVDGRYRAQVRSQVDMDFFEPVDWPETSLADWLAENLPHGGDVSYDGWLHTADEIEKLRKRVEGKGIKFVCHGNLIDLIWAEKPDPPNGPVRIQPDNLAGESHKSKRERLAGELREAGHAAAAITLTDSIAWLLNIRGADIPRNPVVHAFAILHDNARVTLFVDHKKLTKEVIVHLGEDVDILPYSDFTSFPVKLEGTLRIDKSTAPERLPWLFSNMKSGRFEWGDDPCILNKARKNRVEISATREAHLRDGAAVCEFLTWFDNQPPGTITEIDVVKSLENCRRATNMLLDISFDTIAGSGPNGAMPHYRVTETSNRMLQDGELLVLDSGGQYEDGTTDITRTLPVGNVNEEERIAFTRVLQGMIAISRLRWPRGLTGRDLDAIARYPLWLADHDYNHGTGHGVGVALCVHEGPQRLSRKSEIPLEPGMIISNEPGFYKEGRYGIRTENLVVVNEAIPLEGATSTDKLCFKTLNFVPIDRRLVVREMLSADERNWLDKYHSDCLKKMEHRLSESARKWLNRATSPV